MKIKLYIVTYKANDMLVRCLKSVGSLVGVHIINNFGALTPLKGVPVYNNVCRPDWSTGHLSRSWNQALLLGFKDLSNPDADIVCACQDDTVFEPDWRERLVELHERYEFIQQGVGDNFMSWTPAAVKGIGMWDERFNGIAHQEGDYFLRSVLSGLSVTINDAWRGHQRVHNPVGDVVIKPMPSGRQSGAHAGKREIAKQGDRWMESNRAWFGEKWGGSEFVGGWTPEKLSRVKRSREEINLYPYFEKDIDRRLYV